jgi:hypothetical protein
MSTPKRKLRKSARKNNGHSTPQNSGFSLGLGMGLVIGTTFSGILTKIMAASKAAAPKPETQRHVLAGVDLKKIFTKGRPLTRGELVKRICAQVKCSEAAAYRGIFPNGFLADKLQAKPRGLVGLR